MEENKINATEIEDVVETTNAEEAVNNNEDTVVELDKTIIQADDQPTSAEDTTLTENIEGEEVKEDHEGTVLEGEDKSAMVEGLGAMMGGLAETYNAQQKTQENLTKTLETQKQIFENFDNDINSFKANIDTLNNAMREMDTVINEVENSLTATKMYTQLLSKAILVSDVIIIIALILLAIFK